MAFAFISISKFFLVDMFYLQKALLKIFRQIRFETCAASIAELLFERGDLVYTCHLTPCPQKSCAFPPYTEISTPVFIKDLSFGIV